MHGLGIINARNSSVQLHGFGFHQKLQKPLKKTPFWLYQSTKTLGNTRLVAFKRSQGHVKCMVLALSKAENIVNHMVLDFTKPQNFVKCMVLALSKHKNIEKFMVLAFKRSQSHVKCMVLALSKPENIGKYMVLAFKSLQSLVNAWFWHYQSQKTLSIT